jgi:hypothetical protein
MADGRKGKKVYKWTPLSTGSIGRLKTRWKGDVKNDVKNMRINWRDCIRNRATWNEFVGKAKIF